MFSRAPDHLHASIFVPAEGNDLAQLLLARCVNGESPNKRRSPRKSTAARRTTPRSVRSAKVATKTPRAASKRARKSTVVPDANQADENAALPQPKTAPASTKKNKRSTTSKSKAPKSRSQRRRPQTKDVDIDGDDGGGGASVTSGRSCIDLNTLLTLTALSPAPLLHTPPGICALIVRWDLDRCGCRTSTRFCRSLSSTRPRTTEKILCRRARRCSCVFPDSLSTSVKPSRLAPSSSSLQGVSVGKGKRENQNTRGRAVQSTAVDLGPKAPQPFSPSPGGGQAARRGPRGGDYDTSDHSDLLAQKLTKIAPADTRPKSGKRKDTKDVRPPPARRKRTTSKAKADTKRTTVAADDDDGDEQTKRTVKSAVARTQTGGTTATDATAGREAPENSRKRGAEEGRGHEETASPVAPPRGGVDVPDVVLPPTKRARVLQEKSAPRKRKKNVDDGNDASTGAGAGAIRAANNENGSGPPTKKRRRADPKTAPAVRYVVTAPPPAVLRSASYVYMSFSSQASLALRPSIIFYPHFVAYSSFFACSRRRRGKENENGMELSKPARKASKGAMDKVYPPFHSRPERPDPDPFVFFQPLLSPTGAHRKPTAKGKPSLRPGGTQGRSRGLPPDVLRRIKVNAQTLEAPQDIDDDDPIDFLRS